MVDFLYFIIMNGIRGESSEHDLIKITFLDSNSDQDNCDQRQKDSYPLPHG